jgi:hypothetical protein
MSTGDVFSLGAVWRVVKARAGQRHAGLGLGRICICILSDAIRYVACQLLACGFQVVLRLGNLVLHHVSANETFREISFRRRGGLPWNYHVAGFWGHDGLPV